MERIKFMSQASVRPDMILVEIVEKKAKSLIITPDSMEGTKGTWDYLKVICVGSKVEHIKAGDIILTLDSGLQVFEVKGAKYGIVASHLCPMSVSPDNFELL